MALYRSLDYKTSLRQWPFGSREEVQYSFSRWWPSWISNQNYFSFFWSTSHLDISNEVWVNLSFGSGEKNQNRFSTRLLGRPSWTSDQNDFSYFWSTSRLDISYQILSQWTFSIQEKKFKIDLQDGNNGGHSVFPIGTISAIFYLQVTSMILTTFQVNWLFDSGAEAAVLDFRSERF